MFKVSPLVESWLLGSRKFLIMLAVITLAVTFRLTNLIDGAQMVDLVKMVGIAFMGSNCVENMCVTAQSWATNNIEKKL